MLNITEIILIVIGVITVMSVLSGLFFSFDKGPKRLYTNNPIPEVDSPDFLLALAYSVNSPVKEGGTVQILNNGDGFFPVLLRELDKAEKSISFTVYIWKDGKASDQILATLIKKQRQGVNVRVLLDSFGGQGAPKGKFKTLMDAGGRVERFRTFRFGKLTKFHRRTHRRAIIIDGQVGFTGGMAVKDTWLGNAENERSWRDMMFMVTGPLARSLQIAFSELWTSSCGEILFGSGIFPLHLPSDTPLRFIHLVSSPSEAMNLTKFMVLSMAVAKRRLYIATPYFIPDRHTLATLMDLAKAGVDVRLMLPNKHVDAKTVRWNSQNFYYDLLQAGARIYEYQPTFIHNKYLVVDGLWSVIGSNNQNYRSRSLDEENAFGIRDATLAAQLEETFTQDMKFCKEITRKSWRKRSFLLKMLVILSRALEEQS